MKEKIINALKQYIDTLPKSSLKDAIEYALLAGGKRLRPHLMLEVIEGYGLNSEPYLPVSISLEMLHTYSLIHDDLPSMDNDTLRRGKPTLHIAFNEGLAILAGDALLTDSFQVITQSNILNDVQKKTLVDILSKKTGSHGMIYGQVLDLESEGKSITLETLNKMYAYKTANLLQASLMFGAAIASPKDISMWETLGYELGLLFQIQDDVLEETSTIEKMGKSKTDTIRDKPTYVSLIGLEASQHEMSRLSNSMRQTLKELSLDDKPITALIESIIKRDV
ncbi:MAG: polyprenyl synthetase family protein [Acholeplasmataceae bacterium]